MTARTTIPSAALPLRRYGPAVLMSLAVPVLSLLPSYFFNHVTQPLPPIPGSDKIVHALMYAALTAAYLHALTRVSRSRLATVLRVVVFAALYGLAMEACQYLFTTSRSMDPFDALANTAGALSSALIICVWARRSVNTGPAGGAHVGE